MTRIKALAAGVCLAALAGCWGEKATQADWSKLGTADFSSEAWAAADQETRGQMVASLLAGSDWIGQPGRAVTAALGAPTGYYDYDSNLAYVVGPEGAVESVYADGYLLVFSTKDGLVDQILAVPDIE